MLYRLTIYAFTLHRKRRFWIDADRGDVSERGVGGLAGRRRRILVEDGLTGVTPPDDVDALVAALEPLMRDPAAAIAGAGAGTIQGSMRKLRS
jgi:mannosyltransferase